MDNNKHELVMKVGIALSKGISADYIRAMQENSISYRDFYLHSHIELNRRMDIVGKSPLSTYEKDELLAMGRKEVAFMEKHGIRFVMLGDNDYPVRLSQCEDAPVGLFYLGEPDWNSPHLVSIVGTRKMTSYGETFCKKLLEEIAIDIPDLCVVSGLAYGIDATAHQSAINHNLNTIAVMAHGLDMIYPAANRHLARSIIKSGGAIISEYPSSVKPFRGNFLQRNRIVAGLSDLTVIIESDIKGGAMSTANIAFSYSREVMALPGRISDKSSSGCNHLIRNSKAHLLSSHTDLMEVMNWHPLLSNLSRQRNLFPDLNEDEQKIYDIIRYENQPLLADDIILRTGLSATKVMTTLIDLEFNGVLVKLPGNRFDIA